MARKKIIVVGVIKRKDNSSRRWNDIELSWGTCQGGTETQSPERSQVDGSCLKEYKFCRIIAAKTSIRHRFKSIQKTVCQLILNFI